MTRQHTRLSGWIAALLVATLFAWLGTWQLQRMREKQALLEQIPRAQQGAVSVEQALRTPARVRRVVDRGHFLPGTVMLDNQLRQGRAGVRIYRVFQPAQTPQAVLLDLGWLPLPGDRSLPALAPLSGDYEVRGLLAPAPATGIALGPALVATAQPQLWLATRLDTQAIAAQLGRAAGQLPAQVLRLDPALPLGYERDLDLLPNTLPPSRHLGYAVQWYAMALTVLIIALVLEWRARRRNGR
ncbi:SURF1 family protein [Stenotrophomonas sp. YIM B06876]|uniref:SURF1 family protein n=1 Tax=Stenotrophomonas sp. YIM B06876 TaxID=3060211 RepID=UPI002738409C|nr:SURF1 family protein [Stenotrophomonas sp. YIM B06876]